MTDDLIIWLASVSHDPLAFVMGAFPWGIPGTVLESSSGPEQWAKDLMNRIKLGLLTPERAIQEATASGHGIGKSATVAQLIMWAFMTYEDCRGVVTAETADQLKTKTWAELGKWFNLCWFANDYFELTATALLSRDPSRARTWRIDCTPWNEKNPAAFQGAHNKGKRLIIIFDEASYIHEIIWQVTEGALSDAGTEIIWCVFGNPNLNTGRFRECFRGGRFEKQWNATQIDSRQVTLTNKAHISRQIEAYGGEDNDIIRVRWLGQFPLKGLLEFFSAEDIDNAMSRDDPYTDRHTPLALGVDVARYGINNSVLYARKGRDARSIPRQSYNGLNTTEVANKIHGAFDRYRPDGIFIDGGGVGGGVVDECRRQRLFVYEVQFGGKDDITGIVFDNAGERYANKRAAMYGACRAWLKTGSLPPDLSLRTAMLAIRYIFNKADQIQLLSKEDLLDETPGLVLDDLDALCLTFGGPLAMNLAAGGDFHHSPLVTSEWDPYSPERMVA